MDRYYEGLDIDRRRWFFETVTAQIHALLGLEIDAPRSFQEKYSTFVDDLSERMNVRLEEKGGGFRNGAVMRLILRLASDREQPVPSFIRDVCEIQFLSREDRSEYTCHKQSGKPFKINKILLEYAIKSSQIDHIMGLVTKRYCAESCDRLPTGCCHILGYDLGLVPEAMLELQRLEARKNGWEAIVDGVERQCRFHSAGGCTIAVVQVSKLRRASVRPTRFASERQLSRRSVGAVSRSPGAFQELLHRSFGGLQGDGCDNTDWKDVDPLKRRGQSDWRARSRA
jgi:hypothetical protein